MNINSLLRRLLTISIAVVALLSLEACKATLAEKPLCRCGTSDHDVLGCTASCGIVGSSDCKNGCCTCMSGSGSHAMHKVGR